MASGPLASVLLAMYFPLFFVGSSGVEEAQGCAGEDVAMDGAGKELEGIAGEEEAVDGVGIEAVTVVKVDVVVDAVAVKV